MIGGWQITGLVRVTSGLPFGGQIGAGWVTSWYYQSFIVKEGSRPHASAHYSRGAGPEAFAGITAADNPLADCIESPMPAARCATPSRVRLEHATPSAATVSSASTPGLTKHGISGKGATVNFGWEVFNVTNTPRFDVNPNTSLQALWGRRRLRCLFRPATPSSHSAVRPAG